MRKIDRKINLQKANILAEQRYLESKGILNESFDELKRGDAIVWIGPTKQITKSETVSPGAKGEYIGRETSGEEVVEFGTKRFYTSRGTFELADNISNNQDMNNVSNLINHVRNNGGLQEGSESFGSVRLVNKNDFENFIKSNPALSTIYDNENDRFKIYLYADLVGYFNPKLGRIDYEKNSRFAKISDEFIWDRNINQ